MQNVIGNLKTRCIDYCYRVRLEQTAKYAKEHGFDTITTTLFVSPYQKHEELRQIAEEIAKKYELNFLYRDFRVGFREGQAKARELGLYMQKYCGCVFQRRWDIITAIVCKPVIPMVTRCRKSLECRLKNRK